MARRTRMGWWLAGGAVAAAVGGYLLWNKARPKRLVTVFAGDGGSLDIVAQSEDRLSETQLQDRVVNLASNYPDRTLAVTVYSSGQFTHAFGVQPGGAPYAMPPDQLLPQIEAADVALVAAAQQRQSSVVAMQAA